MLRAALRNVLAHKLRLGLTAVAIVLAVAFVAGTYIFTDSLGNALDRLIQQNQPDVIVEAASADFSAELHGSGRTLTVPAGLAADIAGLRGVSASLPQVQVPGVVVLDRDGKPLGARGSSLGSGTALGGNWPDPRLHAVELIDGRPPQGREQVVLDSSTAQRLGVGPSDGVELLLPSGQRRAFTVSGTAQPSGPPGHALGLVFWDLPRAQRLLLSPGQATSIAVLAEPGTSQTALRDEITPLLPVGTRAVTGDEQAGELSRQLDAGLGFLNTFLLVFAIVSVFVAAFLIYNTFAMLVAQRTRELALLRAVGASRGQVLRSILTEAVLVALVASAFGVAVGVGVARILQWVFRAAGAPLPAEALVLQPRTVAVSLVVGLVITVVSALAPARRAATVPPVVAMHREPPSTRGSGRRTLVGGLLFGAGAGLAVMAPRLAHYDTTQAAIMAGVAAAGVLIGLLALSPELSRPAVAVIGGVFRGVTGRLARANSRRNPRRTAATAGALTIGVCLMSTISVLASSTQASVAGIVDDVIGADFVVTGYGFQPFSARVGDAVRATQGVKAAAVVRQAPVRAPGAGDTLVTGVDPHTIGQALSLTVTRGSLDDLGAKDVALDADTATQIGAGIGTVIQVLSIVGPVDLTVVAVYEPAGAFNGYVVNLPTARTLGAPDQDSLVYVVREPAAAPGAVQQSLAAALKPFPNVQVLDQAQFKEQIGDQIGQLLNFLFALLVLAVLIALLGIVNTLALSVYERTQEIGLLRAVGMWRGAVRRTIMIEAFVISVFGAILGLLAGVGFGALLQRVLADQGITVFAVDGAQLLLFLGVSAVGGILASLWPARRGSRLRILDAIATE
ncbi:MAG TPA: FtsX-like permease family protein [Actinomycetota bacterium]|nr:FtsX-like permease family protein [Actinomycetota bacterium]